MTIKVYSSVLVKYCFFYSVGRYLDLHCDRPVFRKDTCISMSYFRCMDNLHITLFYVLRLVTLINVVVVGLLAFGYN